MPFLIWCVVARIDCCKTAFVVDAGKQQKKDKKLFFFAFSLRLYSGRAFVAHVTHSTHNDAYYMLRECRYAVLCMWQKSGTNADGDLYQIPFVRCTSDNEQWCGKMLPFRSEQQQQQLPSLLWWVGHLPFSRRWERDRTKEWVKKRINNENVTHLSHCYLVEREGERRRKNYLHQSIDWSLVNWVL